MISFRVACLVSSVLCLVLFGIFLISPTDYAAGYGAASGAGAEFMGRRSAPGLLGLALITGLLRGTLDLAVQWAISWGMIVFFVGVALTGIYSYFVGAAGQTILLAASGEILLACIFALSLRRPS